MQELSFSHLKRSNDKKDALEEFGKWIHKTR